ncbi:hypothetical protein [uncultured Sphingopyxis sp.]|jgi:hypothetical protein|uniref:hypothetical protein n=1 Tax=uncultured Sphingopyxis sp. TaxID=310581 RepID=UPI0025923AF3|nr:hypothetical protein [uncultured Sphingopyxis sp.]
MQATLFAAIAELDAPRDVLDKANRIVPRLHRRTFWNRHTDARRLIAVTFGLEALERELAGIERRHQERGHIDGHDYQLRNELTGRIFHELDQLDPTGTTRRLLWECL